SRPVTLRPRKAWLRSEDRDPCRLRASGVFALTKGVLNAMFLHKLKSVAVVLSVAVVVGAGGISHHGLAGPAGETVTPAVKAFADGKGGTIPADATVKWIADAKGKPALKVQSKKDDTVILLDRIEFTDGAIEFDALGQSGPRGSNFLGIAFRVVDATTHDA